jgi:hypothetical protein
MPSLSGSKTIIFPYFLLLGSIWRYDRKLLSPSFKYQKFDGFLAAFNHHSQILVKILREKYRKEDEQNFHSTFCRSTMDMIAGLTRWFKLTKYFCFYTIVLHVTIFLRKCTRHKYVFSNGPRQCIRQSYQHVRT